MGIEVDSPLFTDPSVAVERRRDGSLLLRSRHPLAPYPTTIVHSLRAWAERDPDSVLVAERATGGGWRTATYGDAVGVASALGQSLLELGLGPERPLLLLSGNGVDHLLLTLGAMTAGVPVAPVSVAYSLQSHDHARIRGIGALIDPGAVFADDADRYRPALEALPGVPVIAGTRARPRDRVLSDLAKTPPGPAIAAAFDGLRSEALAKILFTSGSTGDPKGVLNTHRMLSSNQQMIRQVWPFLTRERPVIVDWLPWSHTFGGNHNVGLVVTNGGTLFVDAGRPAPGQFAQTIANLREVGPTISFNVPAGYAQLVPALEADPDLATTFFSRLRLLFNAAAALPGGLRDRLQALAQETTGRHIPVTGSWGASETGPAVVSAHYEFRDARCIGVPLPGTELELAPVDDGYEIRVRGPQVTPGYLERPDLTAAAFDAEGFYRSGDAVHFADPEDPDQGLTFAARIAEDFKLQNGTFVRAGALRTALLSAAPVLSDAVIAGEDRDYVAALAWLNPAEARRLLDDGASTEGDLAVGGALRAVLLEGLVAHNAKASSSGRVERLLLLSRPPELDAGEITDKGYVNQRQVLRRRRPLVELLYAEPPDHRVLVVARDET
ncbi:MAG: feruloyl-CoA synthase [Candidatus Dormibacteraceae bacterium]